MLSLETYFWEEVVKMEHSDIGMLCFYFYFYNL